MAYLPPHMGPTFLHTWAFKIHPSTKSVRPGRLLLHNLAATHCPLLACFCLLC